MRRPPIAVAVCLLVVLASCGDGSAPDVRRFSLPGRPSAVAVSGDRVFVADDETHAVWMIDPETGEPERGPVVVARNPIAIAAAGDAVWIGHAGGEITRIDVDAWAPAIELDAGGSITGVAVAPGGAWAADLEGGVILRVDDDEVVERVPVDRGAVRVAVDDDGRVWVTNSERTVTVIEDGEVLGSIDVGVGPIGLATSDDAVVVANADDGTIARIDPASLAQLGPFVGVGRGPIGVAIAGGSAWVANQDDGTVTEVEVATGEVVGTTTLGMSPRGIAASGNAVYAVGTNPSAIASVVP